MVDSPMLPRRIVMPITNETAKAQNVANVVANMVDLGELLERRLGKNPEEQRRQGHIDNEEIHPGQRSVGNLLELAAGKADEDEPEIRQRKIENVDHQRRSGAHLFPTWRGLCIALNGRSIFWKVL